MKYGFFRFVFSTNHLQLLTIAAVWVISCEGDSNNTGENDSAGDTDTAILAYLCDILSQQFVD